MRTIGVLGGLGPQATMDFEARFHRACQALIPQWGNTGYPPLLVYYHRHPPVVTAEDGTPVIPMQADARLFDAARLLGQHADLLVITANAPHMFLEELQRAAGVPILSMIDLVVQEVQRRGLRDVGVLGLGQPRVYEVPLDHLGISCHTISGSLRQRLDGAVLALMEGRLDDEGRAAAEAAVQALRERGAPAIILGCTELPLLLGDASDADDLINPTQILAEAAVRAAIAD